MAQPDYKPFLDQDKAWFEISAPKGLENRILNHVDRMMMKRLAFFKFFQVAALSTLAVTLVVSGVLFGHFLRPMKIVFVYPHSDKVQQVHLVAKFNGTEERYPMQLDVSSGVWRKELHTHKKDIDNYVFEVDELADLE